MNNTPCIFRKFTARLMAVVLPCLAPMAPALGQCLNATYGQWPTAVFTPQCTGQPEVITTCGFGSEFSMVNLTAGVTYTFLSSNPNDFITIGNATGTVAFAWGTTPVTYTPATSGNHRFYTHPGPACGNSASCRVKSVVCSPVIPPGDCVYQLLMYDSFGDGWDASFVSVSINGGPAQNYTVTGAFNQALFGVNIGDVVVVSYTPGTAWPNEVSFTLGFYNGGFLGSWGPAPPGGVVYSGVVDCIPPPAPQEDCIGAFTVCSDQGFNNNTNNTGQVADLNTTNQGCLASGERQGTWYTFSPSESGQIGLNISPVGNDDYDWAVWGPYAEGSTLADICPPAAQPIRCSFASGPATFASTGSYDTGFGHPNLAYNNPRFANPLPAHTDPVNGDGWTPGLNVTEGQVYVLYIDNWSQSGLAFNLEWALEGGASLDCTVLPVRLLSLEADAQATHVDLRWSTATEIDNDHFVIERSADGHHYEAISTVPGQGTTYSTTNYVGVDPQPLPGTNHYRLMQVDHDGHRTWSNTVVAHFLGAARPMVFPNPGSGPVQLSVDMPLSGEAIIRILDAAGRVVLQQRMTAERGRHLEPMDLSRLDAGSYFVAIQTADGILLGTVPFVKH